MYQGHWFSAIILMGGCGERFGSFQPKQFHNLSGKKIYHHTLDAFKAFESIDEIILVCNEKYVEEVEAEVASARVRVLKGGMSRQESSYAGLQACQKECEFVLIHDAVRPFVSREIIEENMKQVLLHKAIDTCVPSADTIVHSDGKDSIVEIPDRNCYLRGQTPQTFSYPLILGAHEEAIKNSLQEIPDDCRLVKEMGSPVSIVMGEARNIKITTELDLFVAEQLLRIHCRSMEEIKGVDSLRDKTFVVTGGSSGIGLEVCNVLEKKGAKAISLSRSSAPFSVDMSNIESIKSAFREIGVINGLINCAGLLVTNSLNSMSDQQIQEMLSINLQGLIFCCKYATIEEGGHLVNIASSSFSKGRAGAAVYSCSKAAVVNLTQALAEEYPELFVNVVIPQRTNTPMRQQNFKDEDPSTLLSAEEVAQTIVHLLQQGTLTGEMIEVKKL